MDKEQELGNIEATAYDCEGNVIKCSKCEKDAIGFAIGNTSMLAWCEDHSIMPTYSGELIYRPQNEK